MAAPQPSPLGPPPLGVRPEGLLDLLSIKSGGRFPQHLADTWLQPGIELADWYLEQEAIFATATLTWTAAGTQQVVGTVPAQEQWLLRSCSMWSQSAIAAGVTRIQAAMFYTDANNTPLQVLLTTPVQAGPDYLNAGVIFPRPIIVPPGTRITAQTTAYAGAAGGAFTCAVRYCRLPF